MSESSFWSSSDFEGHPLVGESDLEVGLSSDTNPFEGLKGGSTGPAGLVSSMDIGRPYIKAMKALNPLLDEDTILRYAVDSRQVLWALYGFFAFTVIKSFLDIFSASAVLFIAFQYIHQCTLSVFAVTSSILLITITVLDLPSQLYALPSASFLHSHTIKHSNALLQILLTTSVAGGIVLLSLSRPQDCPPTLTWACLAFYGYLMVALIASNCIAPCLLACLSQDLYRLIPTRSETSSIRRRRRKENRERRLDVT